MVKAMELGSFSNENGEPYIINGPEDLQAGPNGGFLFPYITEWIKVASSGETGQVAACTENISRLDCEKCTRIEDVIDLDIPGRNKVVMLGIDRCGTFVPPLSSNTICRPLPPAYDTNDLDNCVVTVECINGVPYYNGSPGVPPLFTGCDVCGNDYYINGEVTTLDCNGNGCWNNVSYWNGSSSAPNNFTGCDYCGNFYYINGEVTTLDCNGNGCWNDVYYINGELTTLDCDGSGCWNGIIYYNGSVGVDPSFSGYSDCDGVYYINGQPTTLDSSGNGCWNDVYYINGELTTLDCDGSGCWNGIYYINLEETTLDCNGNGCWNGILYENGVNIGEC